MQDANGVYMDTRVFTEIVDEVRDTANMCEFSEEPLSKISAWEGTNSGHYMNKILEQVYMLASMYRQEATETLPNGLFTLRDTLIEQDKIIAGSIDGQVITNGGRQ
ncbi:MAG: hypothetical protein E7304_01295 [Butyrivibrio sp.]|uniref:Uncharacterized protein n=1 Tax=Butyrivibrio hungatei TaxID=185008 RepID=A0A1D9P3T4_9FIRM|nr:MULTISPECIES: hypothetical protein [Butyrivibrio]AOZ97287.1 hypothetical protein bhn_I2254 [Butyrivibrio hungatei]MBE5840020.1 hypothetical protein [Butyrivibrio sp.]